MTRKKLTQAAKVRTYISKHPKAKVSDVAKATGVSVTYVYAIIKASKEKATPKVVDKSVEKPKAQNTSEPKPIAVPLVGASKEVVTGITGNTYQFIDFTPKPPQVGFFQSLGQSIKKWFINL